MIRIFTLLMILLVPAVHAANLNWDKGKAHVGKNPGVPDGREGGETIQTAIPIWNIPYWDWGNTSDNVHDYDEVCPFTDSWSPDVVYSFTARVDVLVDIDLCYSTYDTKVYVYENTYTPGSPYACDDDFYGWGDPCGDFVSAIWNLPLSEGNTYYIVIDGYWGDAGYYEMLIEPSNWTTGGDVTSTATPITDFPYVGWGNTCAWFHDYDEICPFSGSFSGDVVYSIAPPFSTHIDIDLCGSHFDSKVYVYEDTVTPGAPYACNDDYYYDDYCRYYTSAILNLELRGGHVYYIVVDGYASDCGFYQMVVDEHDPVTQVWVSPTGSGTYPTIQDAVWAVAEGGTVWLEDGTFSGPGNCEIYTTGREITIRSVSGDPEACRIDCSTLAAPSYPTKPGGVGRCLGPRGPIPEMPDGRTLPRGNWGMVFWFGEDSDTVLRDVSFVNAGETALYVWTASPKIQNCHFIGNSGIDAGGIFFWGSESIVENCLFQGNIANNGAGLSAWESALDINGCIFVDNLAYNEGGGIYIQPSTHTDQDQRIRHSLFARNNSTFGGAVSQNFAVPGAELFMQCCTLAENGAGVGSGIAIHSGDMRLWTSLVAFNNGAAGIECNSPGTLDIACCDIFGNPGGDWVDCMAPWDGIAYNFWLNPEFCGILGTGIYTLQSDSPCAPDNNPCGIQVGCELVDCGESNTAMTTWSDLKVLY